MLNTGGERVVGTDVVCCLKGPDESYLVSISRLIPQVPGGRSSSLICANAVSLSGRRERSITMDPETGLGVGLGPRPRRCLRLLWGGCNGQPV